MATDIPDWTQSVTIESGTVTVKGAVDATITSGTVDATITNASVPISGSVSISSGTVDISAGTVDVQNAAGTVIATGNAIDFLVKFTKTTTVGSIVEVVTFTAPKVYGALLVVLTTPKTGVVPYCALAYDSSMASSHGWVPTFVAAFANGRPGQTAQYQAVVPFANDAGDKCTVSVRMSGTSKGTLTIYGLTRNPGVALRPDGRAYPLGALGASKQAGTTAVALVTTTAPLRPLVKTLSLSATFLESSALYRVMKAKVYGTLNGATVTLLQVVAAGLQTSSANSAREYPGGFLLDAGSSVEVIAGGVVGTSATNLVALADLTYDLVV